jgi:hypothetical protein
VTATARCPVCDGQLPARDRPHGGRKARYCSGACKAKAYRDRQQASEPPGTDTPPLTAAARHARAIEIRQQVSELTGVLADTASGQQALFAPPGPARRTRPAETARTLHRLITELTALATTATVTKRVTLRRAPAGTPQTSPLFGEPGASARTAGATDGSGLPAPAMSDGRPSSVPGGVSPARPCTDRVSAHLEEDRAALDAELSGRHGTGHYQQHPPARA